MAQSVSLLRPLPLSLDLQDYSDGSLIYHTLLILLPSVWCCGQLAHILSLLRFQLRGAFTVARYAEGDGDAHAPGVHLYDHQGSPDVVDGCFVL
jgi:hypothetical protein